jgi:hypothetical protein
MPWVNMAPPEPWDLGGRRNEGLQKRSETDEFTICPLLLEQGHSKKKTEILMAVSLKSPWHTKRC